MLVHALPEEVRAPMRLLACTASPRTPSSTATTPTTLLLVLRVTASSELVEGEDTEADEKYPVDHGHEGANGHDLGKVVVDDPAHERRARRQPRERRVGSERHVFFFVVVAVGIAAVVASLLPMICSAFFLPVADGKASPGSSVCGCNGHSG